MKENQLEQYLRTQYQRLFDEGDIYKFVSPNRRFVPDQFLDTGRVVAFVELKRSAKAKIHAGQIREIYRIRNRGRIADILWSKDQIDNFLQSLKGIHNYVADSHTLATHHSMFERAGAYNFDHSEEGDSN